MMFEGCELWHGIMLGKDGRAITPPGSSAGPESGTGEVESEWRVPLSR